MKNCVDIIRPFIETAAQEKIDNIQVIGGNGSAALAERGTIIVPEEKRVIAPADLNIPQYRDDGNKRDLDVLVLTTDSEKVRQVEAMAQTIVGDELELSFFGLLTVRQLDLQKQRPIQNALMRFTADRYAREDGGEISEIYKALFPFAARFDNDFLETWQLSIGENDPSPAPIPHPGATILNYLTRSISGLRPKDSAKVSKLVSYIASDRPEVLEWMRYGPGSSHMDLAQILQTLSHDGKTDGELYLGDSLIIPSYEDELMEHQDFMIEDEAEIVKHAVMRLTYLKAKSLRAFETNPRIVTLWQRYAESRAGKLVKNQ